MPGGARSADAESLADETTRLLSFGTASADPSGGFGWLRHDGTRDPSRPVALWTSCRMLHVYALADLMGWDGAAPLVEHGIGSLEGPFRDDVHGGWYAAIDAGLPAKDTKQAYEHAFVILAAASAASSGRPRAAALLDQALDVHERHFWDQHEGMPHENFSRDWSREEPYRGVNSAMHTVEAYLAAYGVTGRGVLLERAARITERVVHRLAASNDWLVPEHFTADWRPLLDYNADNPAHPFRPFGATIGHLLEWSRLTVQVEQSLAAAHPAAPPPAWMLPAAEALYDAAVTRGWNVDGAPGFVYTVDWSGVPVVRERLHWVIAEAMAAAAVLAKRTGLQTYDTDAAHWWAFARDHHVDMENGSWWHELSPTNVPSATVWSGKPDLYHAVQATLMGRLPIIPAFAPALAAGGLREPCRAGPPLSRTASSSTICHDLAGKRPLT